MMKNYSMDKIRNVALLGHGGSGKTTLAEQMLFISKVIKRPGKVEDGNTVSDYTKVEKEREVSISTSLIPIEWKDFKYNIFDVPGYFDFVGEMQSTLKVVDGSIIMVDASSGIEVGTEKAWKKVREIGSPSLIMINKMDKENVNFSKILNQLRDKFGKTVIPFEIPMGEQDEFKGFVNIVDMRAKEYDGKSFKEVDVPESLNDQIEEFREMLIESVAESDEELLEKYFEGEEFTRDEIHRGLRKGVVEGSLIPVVCGSMLKSIGVDSLLNMISEYMPSPKDGKALKGVNPKTEEIIEMKIDASKPFSALIFKTIADPYVGKISLFKVISGELSKDDEVLNVTRDHKEKIGNLFTLRGKEQIDVSKVIAGDIGAISKLDNTFTNDTLCNKDNPIKYDSIDFPKPTLFMSVEPKSKSDEEKIGTALHRLTEEDLTFIVERNRETKQQLIGGQGVTQLEVIKSKLKNDFGVEVELSDPKIAYRETIKGTSSVQGKHKKQSGGAGQYGDVHIRFEPSKEEFEFDEEIFGGSVPKQYIPAVEKGLRESITKGVLAGFPVVNLKAVLFDGSYHPVDSSEMAFKIAASLAFKKGIKQSKPVLLEPIMKVEISIPEEYLGDIMGDMNKRRGRILGMEQQKGGGQLVIAEAPQSELFKYTIDLKSMTQARGSFTMEFVKYEEVPSQIAEKIIEEANKDNE